MSMFVEQGESLYKRQEKMLESLGQPKLAPDQIQFREHRMPYESYKHIQKGRRKANVKMPTDTNNADDNGKVLV